jgi:hypothetical protein
MKLLSGDGIRALAKTQAQLIPSAAPPPPAWDPNDQAGLILDLDANTLASMFTDLAKTTNPTDGQAIKVWRDQDDKAVDFVEIIAAQNPTYRSDAGGHPAVDFSVTGAERVLRTTGLTSTNGEYTEYSVIDIRDIAIGTQSRLFDTQTGRLILSLNDGISSYDSICFYDGTAFREAAGVDLLPTGVCVITWKMASAGAELFRQAGGTNTLKLAAAYTARNYGGQTTVGLGQSGGATTARVYLYQHLVYEGVHSAGEQNAIRAGLVAKFSGLAL